MGPSQKLLKISYLNNSRGLFDAAGQSSFASSDTHPQKENKTYFATRF